MTEHLLKCLATCLRIVLNCIMMLTYYTYIATAIILVYTSLVYRLKVGERTCIIGGRVKAIHILEIIIGMEMIISISCLLYYIGKSHHYNVCSLYVCMCKYVWEVNFRAVR